MNIGIFDSGIGGLSIARTLLSSSSINIIYVADSANMPYGSKSPEQIFTISSRIIRFLEMYNVDAIIIACHTASTLAGKKIQQFYNIPIITLQESIIEYATQITKNNSIGLIATPATIASSVYHKTILQCNKNIRILEKACPTLASSIEHYFDQSEILQKTLEMYLQEMITTDIDTLILGCTHYSLIKELIQNYIPNVALISSEDIIAKQFLLEENSSFITPRHQFFVSGDQNMFQKKLDFFLNFWNIKNICYTIENTPWKIIQ